MDIGDEGLKKDGNSNFAQNSTFGEFGVQVQIFAHKIIIASYGLSVTRPMVLERQNCLFELEFRILCNDTIV